MKNNKYKARRFLFPILSLVLISIVLIASVSSYISINMFTTHTEENIQETTLLYTQRQKEKVYKDVNFVNDSIKFKIKSMEERLKIALKEKLKVALNIASSIHNKYKNSHNKEEIKEKIAQALTEIKFNNRNYYFMYDNKTKVIFGHPLKEFIGKNMTNFRDARGRSLMQTDAKILEKKKIGFNKIYFLKPDKKDEQFPKITCIGKYEPLDLVLGLGEYLDVIEKQVKKELLSRFSNISYEQKDSYIVILDLHNKNGGDEFATVLLNSNKPELQGKKVTTKTKDIKGNLFKKDFLELVVEKGSGYSSYWYKKPSTNVPSEKISYFLLQEDWNWIIASGFYYEDLEKQILKMRESVSTHTKDTITKTIMWIAILSLFAIIIAIFVSFKIDQTIKAYINTIINYEDHKRKQENLLMQQSKMAAMGEMLGNIAHQWRQPLSTISIASTGAKLQREMNCLTDKQLDTVFDSINNSAQFLSHTIDDFRDFFNPSNNKVNKSYLADTFNKTLNIIEAQFVSKEIEIIQNIENIEIKTIENELIQVIINILNNARDALLKLKNQKRLIIINIYKEEKNIAIKIKDNAGGIPEDIIDKIFEPYFTTKHQSQGTGIGLYMSEEIIKLHLNGAISVDNDIFEYEGIEYTGAMFKIILPLS
ncbi:MAG: cache domain-containing protein [Arcobacter sp.]|uniref:sensor histidine kinase n=1 Tax=Arcobacter sp. TaxID=1872629 RepID=UPI003B006CBA